jgi:glycosyltransferase involved in cell wall biosynthesis
VSSWGPHKGLREALEVIAQLAAVGHEHRLVVAGWQDPWMLRQVHAAVAAAPRPDLVDVVTNAADLAPLFRGAAAQVVTSRAEGFGLPALEAMACGTTVVAFHNTSLPEVIGDGGMLVPDGDVRAMVAQLDQLLRSEPLRADLHARARRRAASFTWDATVRAHATIYREVAAGGR